MKRRAFLQTATITGLGANILNQPAGAAEPAAERREIYELRVYTLKPARKPILDEYLSKAFIPALRRIGIGPVGVFTENLTPESIALYVLTVLKTAGECITYPNRLAADEEYQKAAAEYLNAPASDPVYDRIESFLHQAIAAIPKLEKPDTSKARLLNLRIYESHNERAAKKKVEMFNLHEMPIFRRVGLTPVMFGETIVGSKMPNLTYLLVFPDDAERVAAWKRFGGDDDWKKLKAIPEYADKEIVSHITDKILSPEAYSEI